MTEERQKALRAWFKLEPNRSEKHNGSRIHSTVQRRLWRVRRY